MHRYALLFAATTLTGFLIWRALDRLEPPAALDPYDMRTPQHADARLGSPRGGVTPPFDPRFIRLSAFDLVSLPTIASTTSALGGPDGAMTYNVQPTGEMNARRGGRHSGDDLNGIGGMNTDLGDHVYAIADGHCIFSAMGAPGWGNIVILAHRTTDGEVLHSFYAHLEKRLAFPGQVISRGSVIGTVGTAGRRYPAHLHLELRAMPTISAGMRGYHAGELPSLFRSPAEFVAANPTLPLHAPAPSSIAATPEAAIIITPDSP